jgi:TfoX/Sxy family transcriptional regulator of competence genes
MAYDLELADRVRDLLAGEPVVEKRMFGGLAFLVRGHLAVCVGGEGGLLLRVDPELKTELLAEPVASPQLMGGRDMKGWLHVDVDPAMTDRDLSRWVGHGLDVVRTLPPK